MKKSLLRRMAPLVAGMLLAAQAGIGIAAYPFIGQINWPTTSPEDQYCTVSVDQNPSLPYIAPAPATNNYYWWFDGLRDYAQYSDHNTTANVYPGTYNVCVYVYGNDTSGNYSYAISDRTTGAYIYNGP